MTDLCVEQTHINSQLTELDNQISQIHELTVL